LGTATVAKAGIGIFGHQALPSIISLLLFWPVLVTQLWGFVQQMNLDEQALALVEESLKRHAEKPEAASAAGASSASAAAPIVTDSAPKFCPSCGSALVVAKNFCTDCGAKLVA
jgi:hypothetical protein